MTRHHASADHDGPFGARGNPFATPLSCFSYAVFFVGQVFSMWCIGHFHLWLHDGKRDWLHVAIIDYPWLSIGVLHLAFAAWVWEDARHRRNVRSALGAGIDAWSAEAGHALTPSERDGLAESLTDRVAAI